MKASPVTCQCCGGPLEKRQPWQKFCSRRCLRQSTVVFTMRWSRTELASLRALAGDESDTIAGLIREAVYQVHGVGELTPATDASSLVGAAVVIHRAP